MILSALASLFVIAPNLAPVQPYAPAAAVDNDNGGYKTKDYQDSINEDIDSKYEKANQQLS
jgi:hypothetical protein